MYLTKWKPKIIPICIFNPLRRKESKCSKIINPCCLTIKYKQHYSNVAKLSYRPIVLLRQKLLDNFSMLFSSFQPIFKQSTSDNYFHNFISSSINTSNSIVNIHSSNWVIPHISITTK